MIRAVIKSKEKEDISLMINIDNHPWNYICDCGQASGFSVKEIQNTKAIFISHMHIDHFIGWDQIMRHQVGSKQKVIICGPDGIALQIQAKLKAYTWNLLEAGAITYEIREIIREDLINILTLEPKEWVLKEETPTYSKIIYQEDNFKVQFTILDHKTPSIAYRFDENNSLNIKLDNTTFSGGYWVKELKEAYQKKDDLRPIKVDEKTYTAQQLFYLLEERQGASLGVIMDHAANEENHEKIAQLFAKCDQVYMESFFKNEDKELAKAHYHSYAEQSGFILKKIGVKKAIPIHFSRKYDAVEVEELILEFENAFLA